MFVANAESVTKRKKTNKQTERYYLDDTGSDFALVQRRISVQFKSLTEIRNETGIGCV